MLFENEVGLVTAAGIGRAIALQLAADGPSIVVSDIDDEAGQETVSLITAAGGHAASKHANVANVDDVSDDPKTSPMPQLSCSLPGQPSSQEWYCASTAELKLKRSARGSFVPRAADCDET